MVCVSVSVFVYDEVRHPTGRAAQWGMELSGFVTVRSLERVWESAMVCVSVSVFVYDEVRDIDRPCCSMGYGAAWFYHCLESGESVGVRHGLCLCMRK